LSEAAAFDRPRRLVAEALGTAFLLATVVGSGIMAERLAGGNLALALLGNTLPTGAILIVLILILGPVSGAHFNPAVSLTFLLQRQIGAGDALAYVGAQVAGGLAGTWLAHAMFGEPVLMLGTTARSGAGQWLGEITATFGLVATILGCVRFRPGAVAPAVGLYITAAYWFTSSTSFANPAVTIARAFSDSFAGIRPHDAPAFIAAQLIGAVLATLVLGWLLRPVPEPAPAARPAAAPARELG
jgi:glycerol uptake facilitator-like aquaporin